MARAGLKESRTRIRVRRRERMGSMAVSNVRSRWYMQLHWRIAAAMLLGVIAGLVGGEPLAD